MKNKITFSAQAFRFYIIHYNNLPKKYLVHTDRLSETPSYMLKFIVLSSYPLNFNLPDCKTTKKQEIPSLLYPEMHKFFRPDCSAQGICRNCMIIKHLCDGYSSRQTFSHLFSCHPGIFLFSSYPWAYN